MTDNRIIKFRDALRNGDAAEAVERFDDFDAAVDHQAKREGALRKIARRLVVSVPAGKSAHETAQQFLRDVNKAQQARIKAKCDFAIYTQGGTSAESVANRMDDVISTTQTVENTAEKMRDYGDEISLPSALSISGPSEITTSAGSSIQSTYSLSNVGASEETNIEVSLDGHDFSIEPSSIDSLSPEESVTLTVNGSTSDVTDGLLIVSAGTAKAKTGISVIDANDHLERALNMIDGIENDVDRLKEKYGGSQMFKGLKKKLGRTRKRIEEVEENIDSDSGGSVKGKLKNARKTMGAFINQVHGYGLGNTTLQDREESVLDHDAETVIDELAAVGDMI